MFLLVIGSCFQMDSENRSLLKRDYYSQQLYDETLSNSQRITFGDSLITLKTDLNFRDYVELGRLLVVEGKYTECRGMFLKQLQELPKEALHERFYSILQIAANDFRLRNYNSSLNYIYGLLRTDKPDSLRVFNYLAYSILEDYYTTIKKWNLVDKYNKLGEKLVNGLVPNSIVSQEEIDNFKQDIHFGKISYYINKNEFDSAYNALKSIKISLLNHHGAERYYILYAIVAHERDERQLAHFYYKRALDLETGNFNRSCALLGYSKLLLDIGNTAEYLKLWEDNQSEIDKILNSPLERDYLETTARFQHLTGQYSLEADSRRRITNLADSLYSLVIETGADALVNKYEFADIEDSIALADKRNHKSSALLIILILFSILLAGGFVWVWLKNRDGKNLMAQLQEEKRDFLSRHEAEMEDTRQSLELRSRELSSMTMNMANLNEALNTIRNDATGGQGTDKERLARISKVIKDLDRQDNIWEMFHTYFDTVHNSFSSKLFERHPDLTNAEFRMCAFILMDLTTKEIATLTNRSVRTVEVIKYNLRKKLSIEEPTSTYLKRLALL